MLGRSGRLVNSLVEKYQEQGIPQPQIGHYMLVTFLGLSFYIPTILLTVLSFVAIALAVYAYVFSRKNRVKGNPQEAPKFSVLKVGLFLGLIVFCFYVGDLVMQMVTGYRFPWMANFGAYLILAFISALTGAWLCLRITTKWRFSSDPHVFARFYLIFSVMVLLLFDVLSVRFGAYAALSLVLGAVVIISRNPILRISAMLLSVLPMIRLMFADTLPFMAKTLAAVIGLQLPNFGGNLIFFLVICFMMFLWYLPSFILFAYASVSVNAVRKGVKLLRKAPYGMTLAGIFAGYCIFLTSLPAYNDIWKATLIVQSDYNSTTSDASMILKSSEYLRHLSIKSGSFEKQYDLKARRDSLPIKFKADWVDVTTFVDSNRFHLRFVNQFPQYTAELRLMLDSVAAAGAVSMTAHTLHRQHDVDAVAGSTERYDGCCRKL